MAKIGTPSIDIIFNSLAVSAMDRSAKGIVALILKEPTAVFDFKEYKSIDEIKTEDFSAENINYIKECFIGKPSKVICFTQKEAETLTEVLTKVKTKYINWIAIAEGTQLEHDDLVTWVKGINSNDKKAIKAITYKATVSDDMHVVNFINEKVKPKNKAEISGQKYVSRLVGVLAGLPFTQTVTYYVLQDLESVTEPSDLEESVNNGGFVLFNDEGVVRVARGVNSLITVAQPLSDDMKKITIVEAMDLIQTDIRNTFKNDYIGKYKNSYDNQILFISAVNSYFRTLANESVLDPNYENISGVDVEAQRLAWLGIGKAEAETWTDIQVKMNAFRSNIFLAGNIKILDGIEDLKFMVTM